MKHSRRFRYSLRTMFVVLACVTALGFWLSIQVRWIRERNEAVRYHDNGLTATINRGRPAPWQLRVLGARGYGQIHVISDPKVIAIIRPENRPYSMDELKRLFPEADVVPLKVRR